jgi:hypothetical protein
MQKDFHYCVIRVLAEKAGFPPEEAQTIAYASQYVDDATTHWPIYVDGISPDIVPGLRSRIGTNSFDPICTAHSGLGHVQGLLNISQRKVYVSFHFLPSIPFQHRKKFSFITSRNSPLSLELLDAAVDLVRKSEGGGKYARERALIALGIVLHSYADTWAHENFSGVMNEDDNDVRDLEVLSGSAFAARQIAWILPHIGHGHVKSYPDRTHVEWGYTHAFSGARRRRNNVDASTEAAKCIFAALRRASKGNGEWERWKDAIRECLALACRNPEEKADVYRQKCLERTPFYGYDENEWQDKAIAATTLVSRGMGKGSDGRVRRHELRDDRKWFHFHAEALSQRNWVMDRLPQAQG